MAAPAWHARQLHPNGAGKAGGGRGGEVEQPQSHMHRSPLEQHRAPLEGCAILRTEATTCAHGAGGGAGGSAQIVRVLGRMPNGTGMQAKARAHMHVTAHASQGCMRAGIMRAKMKTGYCAAG